MKKKTRRSSSKINARRADTRASILTAPPLTPLSLRSRPSETIARKLDRLTLTKFCSPTGSTSTSWSPVQTMKALNWPGKLKRRKIWRQRETKKKKASQFPHPNNSQSKASSPPSLKSSRKRRRSGRSRKKSKRLWTRWWPT